MTQEEQVVPQLQTARSSNIIRGVLGLILVAPAALFCLVGLVLPTVSTITTSFQKVDLLSTSEWVGGANYARLMEDKSFLTALGFTLSLVGVRLVVVAVVPLLINLQALLWPLVVANSPELQTFPVALLMLRGQFSTAWPILAAGMTLFQLPLFLLFFVIFGVLQVVYLDRLVLGIEAPEFEGGHK
ncbi:MAG: hypothetical protein Fur0044_54710 [Anaerolineae bacterium]|nr:hypothetical protein [Anaerolineae bacterium]